MYLANMLRVLASGDFDFHNRLRVTQYNQQHAQTRTFRKLKNTDYQKWLLIKTGNNMASKKTDSKERSKYPFQNSDYEK